MHHGLKRTNVLLLKSSPIYAVILVTYFIIVQRNVHLDPFATPKNNAYVYSHSLLASLAKKQAGPIYLVADNTETELNRLPEIASMPGRPGGFGYIFPYLTGINGSNFSVISTSQYHSLDRSDNYLAILPPEIAAKTLEQAEHSPDITLLASGYGLDAPTELQTSFFEEWAEEHIFSSHYSAGEFIIEDLFKQNDDWNSGVRPWGKVSQTILVSQVPELTLQLKRQHDQSKKGWLSFEHTPNKWTKASERLLSPHPRITVKHKSGDLKIPARNRLHLAPLDIDSLTITFSESDYIPAFKGYVLFLHNPKIRILK